MNRIENPSNEKHLPQPGLKILKVNLSQITDENRNMIPLRKIGRRGTTVPEVIVVFGIVAILSIVTFSAVRHVTDQTKSVQCLANVRHYGQAILLYLADNNGVLPNRTPDVDPIPPVRFGQWVSPYLSVPLSELRCPLATGKDRENILGFHYLGNGALTETYWTLKNIPAPKSRVVLASEMYASADGFRVPGHFNRTIWGNSDGSADPGSEGTARKPQFHGHKQNRGLNMFFLDGSAKLVSSTENDWAKSPTYGDGTNGGYFYSVQQFDRMRRGLLVFE